TEEFPFYYVNLSFTSDEDNKYAEDYRGKEGKKIWECVVETKVETKDEAAEVVELSWDISEVPGQYYLYLKDRVTDRTTDMRKTPVYLYHGAQRQFSLIVAESPLPEVKGLISSINDAFCYPNPGKGGGGEVSFKVPANTLIKLKIFNLTGELIYEKEENSGAGGILKWGSINSSGKKVASGIYIYTLSDGKGIKKGKLGIIR
ncbi:MAG: T9SS type A sorting domain-containing protein, partial [bacterium]|nr:T9SS type A sorting domain-containing protein [bacterium]